MGCLVGISASRNNRYIQYIIYKVNKTLAFNYIAQLHRLIILFNFIVQLYPSLNYVIQLHRSLGVA